MRKSIISLISLTLILIGNPAVNAANVSQGAVCKKLNETAISKNIKYVCLKSGTKLIWKKQSQISTKITETALDYPHQLIVVAFKNKKDPDFWKKVPDLRALELSGQLGGGSLPGSFSDIGKLSFSDYLMNAIDDAQKYWTNTSQGKLKFLEPKIIYSEDKDPAAILNCKSGYLSNATNARKIANIKSSTKGMHFVAVVPGLICPGKSGEAQLNGNVITITMFEALTHELGHNFGFLHSATVMCPNNNFSKLDKSCLYDTYGDLEDVMGGAIACNNSKLHTANTYLGFGFPTPENVQIGQEQTIYPNELGNPKSLYQLKLNKTTYFIEFRIPKDGDCVSYDYTNKDPGIEIRFIDQSWNKYTYGDLGTTLVQFVSDEVFNNQKMNPGSWSWNSEPLVFQRFTAGKSLILPNSLGKLTLTVISVDADSAKFKVERA